MSRILGAHNTMSGYQPRKWYGYFGLPMAKCQRVKLEELVAAGVRCFDLRLKWCEETSSFVFAHGLIDFVKFPIRVFGLTCSSPQEVIEALLCYVNIQDEVFYFRMTLEAQRPNTAAEDAFCKVCQIIENSEAAQAGKAIGFGGTRKFDWKLVYKFKENPAYEQYVGSMQSTYGKILPFLWAWLNNKKYLKETEDTDKIVLFDFI